MPEHWTHHDPAVRELIREHSERAWDERGRARGQYLGPIDGHYEGCMGWEDCHCATYPNPYAVKAP